MKLSINHNHSLRRYEVYTEGNALPLFIVPYLGEYACRSDEAAAEIADRASAFPALIAALVRLIECPDLNMESLEDESIEAQDAAVALLNKMGHRLAHDGY